MRHQSLIALALAVPAIAAADATPPSPEAAVVDVANHASFTTLAITATDKCGASPAWVVSGRDAQGAGATCLVGTNPHCVGFAGVTAALMIDAVCGQAAGSAVASPSWVTSITRVLASLTTDEHLSVAPIQDSPVPALAIDTTTGGSIALLSGTWQRWDAPSETSSHSIAKRVIDTSALTGVPSFGVITYVYDGGSESGATITTLTVLHPSGTGFAPIASIKLGENAWSLATEDRSKYINRISPRFDVELSPVIENATLVLRVQRDVISKELRGRCNPKFEAPVNAPCQRAAMKAIAGSYRLHAGAFERVAAPRVKAGRRSPRP